MQFACTFLRSDFSLNARAYTIEPDCMSCHCSSCFRHEVVYRFVQRVERNSILLEFCTKVSRRFTPNPLRLTQSLGGRKWPQWLTSIDLRKWVVLKRNLRDLRKQTSMELCFVLTQSENYLTIVRKFVRIYFRNAWSRVKLFYWP